MTDNKEWREFNIEIDWTNVHVHLFVEGHAKPLMNDGYYNFEVIEYAAYEAEKQRADALEITLKHVSKAYDELYESSAHVENENQKLKEALEKIADDATDCRWAMDSRSAGDRSCFSSTMTSRQGANCSSSPSRLPS